MGVAGGILNAAVRLGLRYSQALFAAVGKAPHKELSDQSRGERQRVGAEKLAVGHHSTILSV